MVSAGTITAAAAPSPIGEASKRLIGVATIEDFSKVSAVIRWCRRAKGFSMALECDELIKQGLEETIRSKTGLMPDAYFSATKIEWMLNNMDGIRPLAERGKVLFANIDAWLVWKLTGGKVHATDVSNASRTMLFNISSLHWDKDLLKLFRIPRAMLPEVRPSSGIFGYTKSGIPVAGVAGDQQAALFELVSGNLVLGDCRFIEPKNGLVSAITEKHMLQAGKHPGKTNLLGEDRGHRS